MMHSQERKLHKFIIIINCLKYIRLQKLWFIIPAGPSMPELGAVWSKDGTEDLVKAVN